MPAVMAWLQQLVIYQRSLIDMYVFVLHIKPGNEVSVDRSVKKKLWVTQTTKILSYEIITPENFIPRKFPIYGTVQT